MSVKYIFVTGGVVSGLGKGITAASLGRLLKSRGVSVTIQKFDPYINVDPGTMSPYQHGEVFVTEDGAETDLDLGHYERFIDENLTKYSNVTTGKIYLSVITKERKGNYLGDTVQVVPNITNEIKSTIYKLGKEKTEVVITEIGGTVGDIESLPFLEAIRQVKAEVGADNVMYIHVTLVPYLAKSGELKTKPTQHSVKELRALGIQPDVIVCRTEYELSRELKDKIGLFCNIDGNSVIQNLDAGSLYEIPLMLEKEGLAKITIDKLKLDCREPNLSEWKKLVDMQKGLKHKVKIALVGKYVQLHDAYISVVEGLKHGGIWNDAEVEIEWIDSEGIEKNNVAEILKGVDGIIVPGGFGYRGIEGMILAIQYARENKIPFFGICLGMQMAVVEFARDVCGLKDANSSEFTNNTKNLVIDLMPGQRDLDEVGGSMRLGVYPCKISKDSRVYEMYQQELIYERHRHRYEFNNEFRDMLKDNGLVVSGVSPDDRLVEIIEVKDHPWFIATQFHPEFKSRPNRAHQLFRGFIAAAREFGKTR
ncbi:MAG: CTP synthase [Clostridiales bacterium]|nr:CTP synthase [Clostridiales bacterium]